MDYMSEIMSAFNQQEPLFGDSFQGGSGEEVADVETDEMQINGMLGADEPSYETEGMGGDMMQMMMQLMQAFS
jgi:hypothetical protein